MISGSGGITKNGSGTLTLSANNTYTGVTTVAAGLLFVNGQQSSSPVVLTGGTLGGTGRVGSITGTSGAIKPGTAAAPGILNSGNVSLNPGSSLVIDLDGLTAGTGYRQLNVNGSVSLGGSTLDVSANFPTNVNDKFTIINNDGNDPVSGTFAGLPEGAQLTLGGFLYSISYQGTDGTGNDVVLTRLVTPGPPPPSISVGDVIVSEGDSGTTPATFTLTLSAPSAQTVTVDYSTADETATSPDDYVSASGTLTFNPGETTKPITVLVNGDTLE